MEREITPVEGDLGDLLKKHLCNPFRTGFIKLDGVVLAEHCTRYIDAIENFQVRDDDIWVCSFPKSGTTWTQEMVWCIANDSDFEKAKVSLDQRFPHFEVCCIVDVSNVRKRIHLNSEVPLDASDSIKMVENMPSPRFIKTHLPFHLLPRQLRTGEKKPKIIYVSRHPKDACISYYHHVKLLEQYSGDLQEFCKLFIGDHVTYGPYFKNVLGYWKKRFEKNFLFIKYEDMKKDLPSVINKTTEFLGKNLTPHQLSILNEHLSFTSMKRNQAVNKDDLLTMIQKLVNSKEQGAFIRCGNIDQWKTDISSEMNERFDNWIAENLKGTDFSF